MANGTCAKCGRSGSGRHYEFYFGFSQTFGGALAGTRTYYKMLGKDKAFVCSKCTSMVPEDKRYFFGLLGGTLACGAAGWAIRKSEIFWSNVLLIIGGILSLSSVVGIIALLLRLFGYSDDGSYMAIEACRGALEPLIRTKMHSEGLEPGSEWQTMLEHTQRSEMHAEFLTPRQYSKVERSQTKG